MCGRLNTTQALNIYEKKELSQKCYTVYDLFSTSALVTAPYLFVPAISSVTVHNIYIFFIYCTYFY